MTGRHAHVLRWFLPVFLLVGCSSSAQPPSHAGPPHTLVKTFHVYKPDGDLAVRVADVGYGRCWTMSIAAPTSGAFRCLSGDAILDPCFASPKHSTPVEVACVADPWSEAEVLQVSGALPKPPSGGDGPNRPWALELGNGVRCVAASGMVPAVRGVNLGYHCRDGHDVGALDTSRALATAEYADVAAKTLAAVTVTTMWRV